MDRTTNLSVLKMVVDKLKAQVDEKLGRGFNIKVQGKNDEDVSKVIFTLNTMEYNVMSDKKGDLENYLIKVLDVFVNDVKKEFKSKTGKPLTLKEIDRNFTYETVNFAGQYSVTQILVFDSKLVEHSEIEL